MPPTTQFRSFGQKHKVTTKDRGVTAERATQDYLKVWEVADPGREANRLTDTKAAGRIIKSAAADFEFYAHGDFGLIEVKETKHHYRLERAKVPQLPRLRKREMAGGLCIVLVFHSETKLWRGVRAHDLTQFGDKGSWNLEDRPTFQSPAAALSHVYPGVFS